MESECYTYQELGLLNQLTRDYIAEKEDLRGFYEFLPNLDSFEKVITQKKDTCKVDRKQLVTVLRDQYSGIKLHKAVNKNLTALQNANSFTVVTGHQICLFTGPLYFIYKILSTIRLSEELNKKYTNYSVIPVYWMASEDHDFEEINHFFVQDKKYEWVPSQKQNASGHYGKVGAIDPKEVSTLFPILKEQIGFSNDLDKLITLFEEAYNQPTLAKATRFLVNALFGQYGVVCVDGDDAFLKKQFHEVLKDELFQNTSYDLVTSQIKNMVDKGYQSQVNPREINLFYMRGDIRERIVKEENLWKVLNTDIEFTEQAILNELELHPEHFSPNVILRPLYQECILPNLAYYGGGAEVSYWLELKPAFDYHKVMFPVVLLRNAAVALNLNAQKKLSQLNLTFPSILKNKEELIATLVKKELGENFELIDQRKTIENLITELELKFGEIDNNLIKSLTSARVKLIQQLEGLEKKWMRAEKRKNSELTDRIDSLKSAVFPSGTFQERKQNIIAMWMEFGANYHTEIKNDFDPLSFQLNVFK